MLSVVVGGFFFFFTRMDTPIHCLENEMNVVKIQNVLQRMIVDKLTYSNNMQSAKKWMRMLAGEIHHFLYKTETGESNHSNLPTHWGITIFVVARFQ